MPVDTLDPAFFEQHVAQAKARWRERARALTWEEKIAAIERMRERDAELRKTREAGFDSHGFETALRSAGYAEVEIKQLAAGTHNAKHEHPFDMRALVLDGEITLTVDGEARAYRSGEVFTMDAGCGHIEDVGAQGVRYLVGRRRRAG